MTDQALAASGRVVRATTMGLGGDTPKRQLFAIAVGDDEQALAHFKRAYPELEAVEIAGDLSEYSLRDLGLKPGRLVPL